MKILLTGGSGLLGGELIKAFKEQNIDYYAPTSSDCNILDSGEVSNTIHKYQPDIVIHCAAVAKFKIVDEQPMKALLTNIVGTCNVVTACESMNNFRVKGSKKIKLVYISTDHVFDGKDGLYKTNDKINPISKYAKTKAAGELAVRVYDNHLVVRTSFCPKEFPFETAFVDKWTSQDYVDIIAPKILIEILSDKIGIINIGSERRSFYELAKKRRPDVKEGSVKDMNGPVLIDTSLDRRYKNENN
tara:strand:- start:12 stop:746 length:735 start_codon:yes stop_codon:yes gene_type:complete